MWLFITLRPRQNGRQFAGGILNCILFSAKSRNTKFRLEFHWFLRVLMAICHHVFEQATSYYPDQWWLRLLTHICATRPQCLIFCNVNICCPWIWTGYRCPGNGVFALNTWAACLPVTSLKLTLQPIPLCYYDMPKQCGVASYKSNVSCAVVHIQEPKSMYIIFPVVHHLFTYSYVKTDHHRQSVAGTHYYCAVYDECK